MKLRPSVSYEYQAWITKKHTVDAISRYTDPLAPTARSARLVVFVLHFCFPFTHQN
jgi:hypothetical protein